MGNQIPKLNQLILPTHLITNIKSLFGILENQQEAIRGAQLAQINHIDDAFLFVENGRVKDYGPMSECPELNVQHIDATGKFVLPSWCDSHTHLVFAASREKEFVDRIHGLSYEEIANRGGGILNSARKLRDTPEEILLEQAYSRLLEVQSYGTGAIEIKSGYGLSTESELKMLRVIRELKKLSPVSIKSTFLGAHALPLEYKQDSRELLTGLLIYLSSK